MKKSVYLKAFQDLVSRFQKENDLVDYGFDWLRFRASSINPEIDKLFNSFNSTTGPDILESNEYYDSIVLGTSSVGPSLLFQKKVELKNGIVETFSILRLVKNEKNNSYLLDFYGLFFGLSKNYEGQILSIQDYLDYLGFDSFSVTRVDFNFNFYFTFDIYSIHHSILEDYKIKNYVDYNRSSFAYGLYEKKGKKDGKTIYRLTKSFGFRLYDKTQNVVDLGLQQVYPQYLQRTLRIELVCGSDTIAGEFKTFEDFENYFLTFLKNGNLQVEKRRIRQLKKEVEFDKLVFNTLKKRKLDLQSRLYNYVRAGGSLRDVLQSYVVDNSYIAYLLQNNYLKAFALIEDEVEKKLEKSDKKTKQLLRKAKQKLFDVKVLLSNLCD